jgi:putative transposase
MARIVVQHCPHHVTQRGNRSQCVFFSDDDKKLYLRLLGRYGRIFGLRYWAYCLMPNHVHIIAVPDNADSLNRALREAHKKFTWQINIQNNWRGTLWQGRYYSFPLEDVHLYRAIRYAENNPVRAGMVKRAEDYPWSSAASHVFSKPDDLLSPCPTINPGKAWAAYLREEEEKEEIEEIRNHIMTGRPLGQDEFVSQLEKKFDRVLRPKKVGRKKNDSNSAIIKIGK